MKPKTAFSRRVRDACDLGGGGEDLRVIAYFKRAMQWAIRSTNYLAIDSCICKHPSLVMFCIILEKEVPNSFPTGPLTPFITCSALYAAWVEPLWDVFLLVWSPYNGPEAGGKGRDHATKNKPPFPFPTHPCLSRTFFRWQQVEKNPSINSSSFSTHTKYGLKRHLR